MGPEEVMEEVMTRWWLETQWDDSAGASVNLRRFREWWLAGEETR